MRGVLISKKNKDKNSKGSNAENGSGDGGRKRRKNDLEQVDQRLKKIVMLETVIIVLLAVTLIVSLMNITSGDTTIDAGNGIELVKASSGDGFSTYNVDLALENIGSNTASVSMTGEVYTSEMGSANGEEMVKVLKYGLFELGPGDSKDAPMGSFDAYDNWHYVVKVHISWNGGSLELSRLLIPGSS